MTFAAASCIIITKKGVKPHFTETGGRYGDQTRRLFKSFNPARKEWIDQNKTTKKQLEVDFVVTRGSEKYYIQSAFAMNSLEKQEQEERPLNAIGDSFKKIIVVKDNIKVRRNDMGIVTIGIRNFLLDENSLNL